MNERAQAHANANAHLNNIGLPGLVAQVTVRSVYGNPTIYPANETARILAQIAGTKTLNKTVLDLANRLGIWTEEVPVYALREAA